MAEKFNNGQIRFLISTEAGVEGIDLQQQCHCLIHVDLPWNPMRLHERVGRVNRFGQTRQVQVVSLRNPDTVESRIWSRLEEKLGNIMRDLSAAQSARSCRQLRPSCTPMPSGRSQTRGAIQMTGLSNRQRAPSGRVCETTNGGFVAAKLAEAQCA